MSTFDRAPLRGFLLELVAQYIAHCTLLIYVSSMRLNAVSTVQHHVTCSFLEANQLSDGSLRARDSLSTLPGMNIVYYTVCIGILTANDKR